MSNAVRTIDKFKCLQRELTLRMRMYPKWISRGTLSSEKAAHELIVLRAIVEDYKQKLADENPQQGLFAR